MLKRVRWFTVGVVAGAGTTMYSYVRWRESRSRLAPDRVSETVVGAARVVGHQARVTGGRARATGEAMSSALRDALAEGRDAMAEAEARITAELDRPGPHPPIRPGH